MIAMLLAGALLGVGLTAVLAGLRSPAPDLGTAVARLVEEPRSPGLGFAGSSAGMAWPGAASGQPGRMPRPLVSLTAVIAARLPAQKLAADLQLTGTSLSSLALAKVGYALLGLMFPVLLVSILLVAGLALPFVVPVLAGLALGAALSFVPEADLRRRAVAARRELRRTVCAYVELVALERAADAGAVEALERAAAIGSGQGFAHISDALLRARLEGRTPWAQLAALAESLAVPELADVADIMRLSGEDGAAVLPTLRARASSLRGALLQAEVAAANRASERMSIPVALLGVAFMALLGFPALWRILAG